jgi:hypothetical protein
MFRLLAVTVCLVAASAQAPQPDPVDLAMRNYWDARNSGRFDEAAAHRAEARELLSRTPVDAPQFPGRVQGVAQLYRSGGMNAQARAVLEEGLARAAALGDSHPARIQLLDFLAVFWQQNGNLLKALSYREKAVAALDAAPPDSAPPRPGALVIEGMPIAEPVTGNRIAAARFVNGVFASGSSPLHSSRTVACQQLADLYRQLGRPDAAAATLAKLRTLLQNDPGRLAQVIERSDPDQAIALYRKQADQAALNPNAQIWEIAGPLQSIARLYEQQQQWPEAAATLQDVIARWQASGGPQAQTQATGLKLNLARVLQQAGQKEAADQIYQGLLTQTEDGPDGSRLQVLQSYSDYLSTTERAAQAGKLLQGYLADHPDLQPWERSNILFSLANVARRSGDTKLADQYQRAGTELQRSQQPPSSPGGPLIAPVLQKAQAAASQGNIDEALTLAFQAMDDSPRAPDREQVAWQVPSVAMQIANRNAPARTEQLGKAEQLYRRLLTLVEGWSADTVQPLIEARSQYVRFLISQKDRWAEIPAAIERYRETVAAAQGPATNMDERPLELAREFAQIRGDTAEAVQDADRVLEMEASLSGTTSQPYMRAVQNAANAYQFAGLQDRALALFRQAVAIADAVFPSNDPQRGFVRISEAFALANARQFEEAERLAGEAVAIGRRVNPAQAKMFAVQAEQIGKMRAAAESGKKPGNPDGSHWFNSDRFLLRPDGTKVPIAK